MKTLIKIVDCFLNTQWEDFTNHRTGKLAAGGVFPNDEWGSVVYLRNFDKRCLPTVVWVVNVL